MACVTLQVGQCGNQTGESFFSSLDSALQDPLKREVFFDKGNTARAVLVDMEPKVVQRCLNRRGDSWRYDESASFWRQSGSGNNWAFGYGVYGPSSWEPVLERIRHQTEKCDRLDSLLLIKSTAGGTGSGVGAYLAQEISTHYGKTPLISVEMWPFKTGEVCVQSYNTILSISAASEFSDLLCAFENSEMARIAKDRLNIPKPSFNDINKIVASNLSHQFLSGALGAIANHLTVIPSLKIATCRFAPQTSAAKFSADNWSAVASSLSRMHATKTVIDFDQINSRNNVALASNLCFRGKGAGSIGKNSECLENDSNRADPLSFFKKNEFFWNESIEPMRVVLDGKTSNFHGLDRTVSSLSIDQTPIVSLEHATSKANEMLKHNAFVHLYENFGIEKDDLIDALGTVTEISQRLKLLRKF